MTALGCVLPCPPPKERIHKLAEFDLLVFQPVHVIMSESWVLTPVDAFIGLNIDNLWPLRRNPEKIPFLNALLGYQQCPSTVASHGVRNVTNQESVNKHQNVTAVRSPSASMAARQRRTCLHQSHISTSETQ